MARSMHKQLDHALIEHHWYSVPHPLTGQRVDARVTADAVEIFHQQKLVAKHPRSDVVGGLSTVVAHQLPAHRAQADRNPEALQAWADNAGPTIARFVRSLFAQDRPYMGLRPADQVRTFVGVYGAATVEKALKQLPDLTVTNVSALKRKLLTLAKDGAPPTTVHARIKRTRTGCPSLLFEAARCTLRPFRMISTP